VSEDHSQPAIEYLKTFQQTGDEHALLAGWAAATAALRERGLEQDELAGRLEAAGGIAVAIFDYIGNFAWLDGGIEMLRRAASLRGQAGDPKRRWTIQHGEWPNTPVTRSLADDEWTIHHPDGRTSQILSKDWSGWPANGWPMGHTIRTPDGQLRTFEEGYFGDGWEVRESVCATVSTPEHPGEIEAVATRGETRYIFRATAEGFEYQALNAPRAKLLGRKPDLGRYVSAGEVVVVRVMPMDKTQAFVMFAGGIEAEDVFLSMSFWGDDARQKAVDVGAILDARVFMASA
jgi:hypothetical protein